MGQIETGLFPPIIIGGINRLGAGISSWGERALIVAETALDDQIEAIQDQLDSWGVSSIVFSRIGLSHDVATFAETLSLARGSHSRMVISVGGEKVLSLGRLIAATVLSGRRADQIFDNGVFGASSLPTLEIPSSGRHPLMFQNRAILVDDIGRRAKFLSLPEESERLVLANPHLAVDLPHAFSVLSAASVLADACESFLSPRSSFLSDVQSRAAITGVVSLLHRVRKDHGDPDYRTRELEAAVLSAFASSFVQPGAGAFLSWAVAAATRSPQAAVRAVLLPWLLESPLYSGSPRRKELTSLLVPDDPGLQDPAEALRGLFGRLEIPGRLRHIGAELSEALPAAAIAADMAPERTDLDTRVFQDLLDIAS